MKRFADWPTKARNVLRIGISNRGQFTRTADMEINSAHDIRHMRTRSIGDLNGHKRQLPATSANLLPIYFQLEFRCHPNRIQSMGSDLASIFERDRAQLPVGIRHIELSN